MGLFSRKDRAMRKLKDVAELDNVPPFPASVTKVLGKLRNPNCSMAEVAEAVSWDPGLVVRLLKTVNSAAYGLRRNVDNAHHAVSFLGRSNLEAMVLGLAVQDSLPHDPAPGFEPRRYWRTAAHRASLARTLAEKVDPAAQAESFTVGLLQDLAVPLIAHARPDQYGPVLEHWHNSTGESLEDLENEALGWNHAELGGTICEAWDLPESLIRDVRHHHPVGADGPPSPVQLVGLMRETQEECGLDALVEEARSSYGIDPDWTKDAAKRAEEQATELSRLMS
jgi:HD-like signal output (HDOD) protein